MIEVSDEITSSLVVHPKTIGSEAAIDPGSSLQEAVGLSEALGLHVAASQILNVRKIHPATFIGGSIVDGLKEQCQTQKVSVLVFDGVLTPVQQRNLENRIKVKVLDRTGLILEIFSLRARTREGRVQVELARISYERSRLVRTWTHLERQRGGKGFLAGPGERQIESDRRMLQERSDKLRRQLSRIKRTRAVQRDSRKKKGMPVIALVGYTNAGKSTLFNYLTKSNIFAKDMLFATLDPTMRKVELPARKEALLSDTVGFISNLPTELIAAFRATLEEVIEADLVLHVRDISSEQTEVQAQNVNEILNDLMEDKVNPPQIIEVWNKIDLIHEEDVGYWKFRANKQTVSPSLVSSISGEGVSRLLEQLAELLYGKLKTSTVAMPVQEQMALGWLQQHGRVQDCRADNERLVCDVQLYDTVLDQFLQMKYPVQIISK